MAGAFATLRSSLALSHLLPNSVVNRDKIASIQIHAFVFFRQFLALKIVMPFAFTNGIVLPFGLKTIAILSILMMMQFERFYRLSLCAVLGFSFLEVWRSWPFTINHSGLEFGIVLLMCLMVDDGEQPSSLSCADMIKILLLSVWFFSGVHKIVDGYYLNGEFFAMETLANTTTLGHHLNQLHHILGSLWGPIGIYAFSCCAQGVFAFTNVKMFALLIASWLTILVEILLPLSFFIRRFRTLSIIGLFIFQILVTYFSGEIDFAFTAFAILFLFVPSIARFAYPSLSFLFLLVQPWI